jgi:hypothetical protein
MDEQSEKNIEEAEKLLGHATGIGKIQRGECPFHAFSPMACMFCFYGHMLSCHYPLTCDEAKCEHYLEAEGLADQPDSFEDFQRDLESNL